MIIPPVSPVGFFYPRLFKLDHSSFHPLQRTSGGHPRRTWGSKHLKAFIKGLSGLNKCVEFASKQGRPVAVKKSPKKTGEREVKRWGQVTGIQAPPSETPHRRPLH